MIATVAERVAAGVTYLDETLPGWADIIDIDLLDLWSDCRCVLGQLAADIACPDTGYDRTLNYADWIDGRVPGVPMLAAGLSRGYGFLAWHESDLVDLTAEWRRVIGARQGLTLCEDPR